MIPLTIGAEVGAGTGRALIASGRLCAVAVWPANAAVVTSTIVWSSSAAVTRKRGVPSPTEVQFVRPSASQRRQSNAASTFGNVQRPSSPSRVSPVYALPLMVGRVVLLSANMAIGGVRALSMSVSPPAVIARTRRPIRTPMSSLESRYWVPAPTALQRMLITVSVDAQRTHV